MGTRKKKGYKLPPFVALSWEMLNSKAYKDLPPSAGKELPYFLGKVKLPFNAHECYCTEFSFSYREANHLGFSTTTHYRSICTLINKGFIDPYDKGGLRSDGKSYNLFRLSIRWKKYETSEFQNIEWNTFMPRNKD